MKLNLLTFFDEIPIYYIYCFTNNYDKRFKTNLLFTTSSATYMKVRTTANIITIGDSIHSTHLILKYNIKKKKETKQNKTKT